VRRLLIDHFDERAAQPGEPLAVLNRRFAHVYLHHRYALTGAIKYIGGMDFGYALAGEATVPTQILPRPSSAALRRCSAALQPAGAAVPDRVTALIPPVPPGFDGDLTLIPSPAGTAFDPVGAGAQPAQEVVDAVLHPQRAARVVSFHARDAANPGLDEVLTSLVNATWGAAAAAGESGLHGALRRVAQRATLDAMLDLAGSAAATTLVRGTTEQHLGQLRQRLAAAPGGTPAERGHRAAAVRDIERYFDGRDDPAARPRPAPIPLPWP
jgi:hypothetical protein